jgi:hypothetical protein
MTTYTLHFLEGNDNVVICGDSVVQAPAVFHMFLGKSWFDLLSILEATGIQIDPKVNTTKSDWVIVNNIQYELHWSTDHSYLKRISKHVNGRTIDIKFSSLPTLLRKALE